MAIILKEYDQLLEDALGDVKTRQAYLVEGMYMQHFSM